MQLWAALVLLQVAEPLQVLLGPGVQGRGASMWSCRALLQVLVGSDASSGVCAYSGRALSALPVQPVWA